MRQRSTFTRENKLEALRLVKERGYPWRKRAVT